MVIEHEGKKTLVQTMQSISNDTCKNNDNFKKDSKEAGVSLMTVRLRNQTIISQLNQILMLIIILIPVRLTIRLLNC